MIHYLTKFRTITTILISIALLSCAGEDGMDGTNGTNGLNGTNGSDGADGVDGASIGLITESTTEGCNTLTFYYDANNNQVKEASESVISSFEFCNGVNGTDGTDGTNGTDGVSIGMFTVNAELTDCEYGGKLFSFYSDTNGDGEYNNDETIISTQAICNGETGSIGETGANGDTYNMFIETATVSQCTNSGFVVNVYLDSNTNGLYDVDVDTITSENVICFPDRNTLPMPDYSALGHSFLPIGIWKLYSITGTPVAEEDRFTVYIYPDELNPNVLDNETVVQSGWLDFNTTTKIGWTSNKYSTPQGVDYDGFNFDESKIEGLSEDYNGVQLKYFPATETKAEYLYFDYPYDYRATDSSIFPTLLRGCVFYRVNN